ncbi:MAG: hypothetical protein JWN69_763 [Alphaproteobacteria bacterium]|nr:hypothetical protein [Alphaproteobacteria bacterium]
MPVLKKLLAFAAPAALLALSACATGFPAQVARFQAMPAPQGQSFVIQATDPRDRGGLEFAQYAELVRRHLIDQGYSEAASPHGATLVVSLGYGVDNGQTRIVSYPSPGFGPHFGYWPYYSRFGYSPFYQGWHDPFLFGEQQIDSYTVYTSYVDLDIKRAADGQSVFEGKAKAHSRSDELPRLVPNLVEAIFTGFPGRSGEVVKITVPPPRRAS